MRLWVLGVVWIVQTATGQQSLFDPSTCGIQKGCLFYPTGCNPSQNKCTTLFSYLLDNTTQRLDMQLAGVLTGGEQYVAVGFSTDNQMGDDMVVSCANVNNQATAALSQNVGKSNQVVATNGILESTSSSVVGNEISCSFSLPIRAPVGVSGMKNLTTPYYPLMAIGPVGSNGQLQYHTIKGALPRTDFSIYQRDSSGTVAITNGTGSKMNSTHVERTYRDKLLISHGILMTCSWMVFLSTGILSARYLREHAPNSLFLGVKMWFNLHRALNMFGIAANICGFVIIFVVTDWTWVGPKAGQSEAQQRSWTSIHAILGLLACCIAWAQPLNAVFRCNPTSKIRFIFNAIHRFFGAGAFVLAMAAIIIACIHFKPLFSNQKAAEGLSIAYVAACALSLFLLEIIKILRWWKNRSRVHSTEMEMSRMGVSSSRTYQDEDDVNKPYNYMILLVLLFHTVVAVGCAAAISVMIGLKPSGA